MLPGHSCNTLCALLELGCRNTAHTPMRHRCETRGSLAPAECDSCGVPMWVHSSSRTARQTHQDTPGLLPQRPFQESCPTTLQWRPHRKDHRSWQYLQLRLELDPKSRISIRYLKAWPGCSWEIVAPLWPHWLAERTASPRRFSFSPRITMHGISQRESLQ